jgi:hypothetical protein
MSNKRHVHNTTGKFKGNVPKAPVEWLTSPEGHLYAPQKVSHVRGSGVYHPTKGWRVQRSYVPHTLLHDLLNKIGINIYQSV